MRNVPKGFALTTHHMSRFTCVAIQVTDSGVDVVVVHSHGRHHNSANGRLAGVRLRGNARNAGLAVPVGDEALLREGPVDVTGGVWGRRAVHRVTTALLFVVGHTARGPPTKGERYGQRNQERHL